MVENWDGPPTGYDWKQFLASVRLVRFTKLDRRPWLRSKNGDKREASGSEQDYKPNRRTQPGLVCFRSADLSF